MRQIVLGFGIMTFCLLILFKIGQTQWIKGDITIEIILSIVAILFFFIGWYFNRKKEHTNSPNQVHIKQAGINNDINFNRIDENQIKKLGLTNRELEVLTKMADGLSNLEIANALFLSENTIKTHVSNILSKLDAKRRTQAIQIAKNLKIID